MKTIEGHLNASGLRIGIIASRFNSFIVERLVEGAVDTVVRNGGSKDQITLVKVPGSFELPITCKKMAAQNNYDALIAVGAVIRGSTSHYEVVVNEMAKGIAHVSLETGCPIGFGVVTADNLEQAIERAGSKAGNKGAEAAIAAIEMANVLKHIE